MEAIALLKQSPLPVSLVGVVCCSPVQTAFLLHIKPQPYERHTSRDKRRPLHCSLTQKEIQRKAFLFLTTQFYRIVDGSLWMDASVLIMDFLNGVEFSNIFITFPLVSVFDNHYHQLHIATPFFFVTLSWKKVGDSQGWCWKPDWTPTRPLLRSVVSVRPLFFIL